MTTLIQATIATFGPDVRTVTVQPDPDAAVAPNLEDIAQINNELATAMFAHWFLGSLAAAIDNEAELEERARSMANPPLAPEELLEISHVAARPTTVSITCPWRDGDGPSAAHRSGGFDHCGCSHDLDSY